MPGPKNLTIFMPCRWTSRCFTGARSSRHLQFEEGARAADGGASVFFFLSLELKKSWPVARLTGLEEVGGHGAQGAHGAEAE